jgi:hypothetical protein
MTALMVTLGLLMMSHVLYPVVPKFGFRTTKGILTGVWLLALITLAIAVPRLYFFTALTVYVTYGIAKALVLGFFERLPDRDPMLDVEAGDEAGAELREIDYGELVPGPFRLRRKRRPRRRNRPGVAARKRRQRTGTKPEPADERPPARDRPATNTSPPRGGGD